jgi:hypothetical protein
VIATTIPISTKTTIATCIQIQVGDIDGEAYFERWSRNPRGRRAHTTIFVGMDRLLSRPVRKPAAVVALALSTLACLAPSSQAGSKAKAAAPSPALLGGVNIIGLGHTSLPAEADHEIAAARQLHVKIVRTDIPWSALEPTGRGQINARALAFADRLVADASAAGIRVAVTVAGTPCWASSAPPSLLRRCRPERDSKANRWPPKLPADYAAAVAFLARRYGTQLAALEIWNEPDQSNENYFAGPGKAAHYAALVRAAYPAVKQASPNLPVLAGSLVGSNGSFLRALYAAGIKGYYDGLSVHFYNLTLASLRSIHEVQLAGGDSRPLWLDEFGWSSCWPRQRVQQEQACVTPGVQAANLRSAFRAMGHTPYVAAALVYKLQDSAHEDFGMLAQGGAHKPAFTALSHVLSSPLAPIERVSLALRRAGSHVIARGSAPVGDFMQLEAFQGSVLRYRALFILDRFNRYAITLPAVLGTHGLRVRVFQYAGGLARDAQRHI